MTVVQSPDIVSCEVIRLCGSDFFVSELGILRLDWSETDASSQVRTWCLPLDQAITAPPPTRFGIRIARNGPDRYTVHLVWDRAGFVWTDLTRHEIECTDLDLLLDAIGTDLGELLAQPISTQS